MSLPRLALASLVLSAALFAACSDPVPPEPRGAWKVSFRDSGQNCAIASHNALVGTVTDSENAAIVTNGSDGAKVACSVKGSGNFVVDASAEQNGNYLQIIVASISAAATAEAPVDGIAVFASPSTSDTYAASTEKPCKFWLAAGTPQAVSAGKVWLTFECEAVLGGENSTCALEHGIALFEDCKTGEEEDE